jgi:hypothetical protein
MFILITIKDDDQKNKILTKSKLLLYIFLCLINENGYATSNEPFY